MPGIAPIIKRGAFDEDIASAVNAANSQSDAILATSVNAAFAFGSFGTAITLLPSTAAAGTYAVSIYAVITTTIVTATSWSFVLGFTDDQQAQTPTAMTSSTLTAGTANQATYIFRSNGTAKITFTPTAASISAGVIAYSVVLQRIQ